MTAVSARKTQKTALDFRSDTVTQPSEAMRQAMAQAEVGDDVYGEDPTVNRLEAELAERAGFAAGLFVPSCTQANLIAVLTHCQRGEEYIVGDQAHIYQYEAGGASVLGGLTPAVLPLDAGGQMNLAQVAETIKPDDVHFPRTRLLCIENTFHGQALPLDYLQSLSEFRAANSTLKYHLDGARLFNAAVYHTVADASQFATLTEPFDSVSICLSKGLGAPMGAVLCGDTAFIQAARRLRKMVGGGLRQSGIVAAAGLYALEHHVTRLAEDHEHANYLVDQLADVPELEVLPATHRTNMLFIRHRAGLTQQLQQCLAEQGLLVSGGKALRVVTHRDVGRQACEQAVALIKQAVRALAG